MDKAEGLFLCKCGKRHSRFKGRYSAKPASKCKDCHAAYMRAHRPRHSQLSDAQRFKASARSYAREYQKRGHIIPQTCEKCGSVNAEKHHDDYHAPLVVRWLCREHHLEHHGGARE